MANVRTTENLHQVNALSWVALIKHDTDFDFALELSTDLVKKEGRQQNYLSIILEQDQEALPPVLLT